MKSIRDIEADLLSLHRALGAGVHDGLSTLLASRCNFNFLWVSSFSTSAAHGVPDASLIDSSELSASVRAVSRVAGGRPIVVDLDAGHGDELKVFHVTRNVLRAGAYAVCIEDNPVSKRSSLYGQRIRDLVSIETHTRRITSARLAASEHLAPAVIVARTEALVAGLGVEEALRRVHAYVEAGADAIFVQSREQTGIELIELLRTWNRQKPVFLAPTMVSEVTTESLWDHGATHIIFANQALRAAHKAMSLVYSRLSETRDMHSVESLIAPVEAVVATTGADEIADFEGRIRNHN